MRDWDGMIQGLVNATRLIYAAGIGDFERSDREDTVTVLRDDLICQISDEIDKARSEGKRTGEKHVSAAEEQMEMLRSLISKLPETASGRVHLKGVKFHEEGKLDLQIEELEIAISCGGDNVEVK